jgi:hypothetical protein
MIPPDAAGQRQHHQRDRHRSNPMGEVNGHRDGRETIDRWHETTERQGKIRDGEPSARVPHGRAEKDLGVDDDCRHHGTFPQHGVVSSVGQPFRAAGSHRNRRLVSGFPAGRREERQAHRDAEKHLREPGMSDRDRRG